MQIYRGDNVIEHFLKSLRNEEKEMVQLIKNIEPMALSLSEERSFKTASFCHICNVEFDEKSQKVKDHCHLTGIFRGAAHNACNLNYQIPLKKFKIPIFFHNGKKYDFHLFIKELGMYDENIEVLPQNVENYLQIKWGTHLVFKDSIQFLNSSLSKLSESLNEDEFIHLRNHFGCNYHLMRQKGVFPYEWFNNCDKFDVTSLPDIEKFYSKLNNTHITPSEYEYANRVWNYFNCQTFGNYHDLYLITDVLLLCDVFETFRKNGMKSFGLDPAYFISLPAYSWECMLKTTEIKLDLLTDIDKYNFCELGSRGGISTVNHRYARANNPYMMNYDHQKETSYIIYIDKNSLYPEAMSDYLPYAEFKWENPSLFDSNRILSHPDDAAKGYMFEVDLQYPKNLHKIHNDYPLAAEHMTITKEMLSTYNNIEEFVGSEKLIPNLFDKNRYILHYKNLKFYLNQGMILTKIHRVMSFLQSPWMSKYIELCGQLRKSAKTRFQSELYKLMMNSIFGKSMENVRKRCRVELVKNPKDALKYIAKNTYKKALLFNDNLAAIELFKIKVCLNKPVYLGQVILDLSKLYMADFHYNQIKNKYPDCKLLFTDTDSFCYFIKTEDFYQDMFNDKHFYDLSNFKKEQTSNIHSKSTGIFHSDENRKEIGKFKDEFSA